MKAPKFLVAFLIVAAGMLTSCSTTSGTVKVGSLQASMTKERKVQISIDLMQPLHAETLKMVLKDNLTAKVNEQQQKAVAKVTEKLPTLPKNAVPLIPVLRDTLDQMWPNMSMRSFMASKIEQESCISLTHSKCWSPYAQLKTEREYGFGLGQITVAYKADGSERFNVWKDLIKLDPVLKQKWTWENRFDSALQIRATVIKSKMSYDAVRFTTATEYEHLAFGAVTYNSGSVLVDRRLCLDIKGCDPSKWFGNVELHSVKARVAQKGYGKSFFDISREYPKNILVVRRPKYIPYLDK